MTDPAPAADTAASRRPGPPWQILLSGAAWVLTAVTLVVAWFAIRPEATVDEETLGTIRGRLGDPVLAAPGDGAAVAPVLLLVPAGLLVLLAAVLLTGRRWSRYPLVVLAVVGVVLLAASGRWETLPAMALLVVGTIPLLLPGALRYLR